MRQAHVLDSYVPPFLCNSCRLYILGRTLTACQNNRASCCCLLHDASRNTCEDLRAR